MRWESIVCPFVTVTEFCILFRIERIGFGKENKTAGISCDSVRREKMLDLINALIDLKESNPKYKDRVSKQTWISKRNNFLMEKIIKRYDVANIVSTEMPIG